MIIIILKLLLLLNLIFQNNYKCDVLNLIDTEILTEHGKCLDPHEIYSEYGQHPICDVTCDIYHGKVEPNICPLVI